MHCHILILNFIFVGDFMKYTFNDLLDNKIYDNTTVMFITGKYNIFNNMVSDELKSRSISDDIIELDNETLAEFNISSDESSDYSTTVDFDTFIDVKNVANINGKWFCKVDLSTMTKKSKEVLNNYIKQPSSNGILVVTANEFMDYKYYLNNKIIMNSNSVHLIQLNWPNKKMLEEIVIAMFKERSITIDKASARLFIMRMSNLYDNYIETIDRMCDGLENYIIDYKEMQDKLKGIQNYVIEDFVELLLEPLINDKTNGKKIYKMLGSLLNEFEPQNLVYKIIKIAKEELEFREYINSGYIPIKVHYSFKEIKKAIGDKSEISKLSEYQFRKKALLASKTSLRDWQYIILILSNVRDYNRSSYEKVLYTLVSRSIISSSRLNNDIGIDNILTSDIKLLDTIRYEDKENEG